MDLILIKKKRNIAIGSIGLIVLTGAFIWKTRIDLMPLPNSLTFEGSDLRKVQVLDRHHVPLTVTYQNRWNIHDYVPLHAIPAFLQKAIIISEDQRFYEHNGVDWKARFHALIQNIKALGAVRGASTLSEQVIRMWHPRPRTLWSRWLEGFEATQLEKRFSKSDILEFYLNQVPYAGQRRGVVQAAHYYFDRDLDTLSQREMLALVVMVRAPGRMNLHRGVSEIKRPIRQLALRLFEKGLIDEQKYEEIQSEEFQIKTARPPVNATHFVHHIYHSKSPSNLRTMGRLQTTLDSSLQDKLKSILDNRLKDLNRFRVRNGAVLAIDHQAHEVLAWVNGGDDSGSLPQSWIDAVTTPRQPGSTLKPFLYAMALEKGWTAATKVDDYPLTESVGVGLHTYHNYSHTYYGPVTVRDALGNSLNTPAVRAMQYVGLERFWGRLWDLGFHSLRRHPDHYGDGLALGNGEITLFELVRAYSTLAQRGVYHPLRLFLNDDLAIAPGQKVFSPEVSSLIGNILSDPEARKLEFGRGSLLRFPVQTAVKTGTSSDYRDAWAVGFNHRYAVGVWMGNLDGTVMDGITGATGPALVLRSIFAELNRNKATCPLYFCPRLVQVEICRDTGRVTDGVCPGYSEWFLPGTEPEPSETSKPHTQSLRLLRPTDDLQMALDPRIPDEQEAFVFQLSELPPGRASVEWFVDDVLEATTPGGRLTWRLKRGRHRVWARAWLNALTHPINTSVVNFTVK
jgi:penicillin-binding protein 1C